MLGFGLGIDSLGDRYVQICANPNAASTNRCSDGRYRLFDKSRYSYLLISDAGAARPFYPSDSGMRADGFPLRAKRWTGGFRTRSARSSWP